MHRKQTRRAMLSSQKQTTNTDVTLLAEGGREKRGIVRRQRDLLSGITRLGQGKQ